MKLTDQEQVVLKAIHSVGRNGLAEISKVLRAVGYPKATTKKILVGLSEKGVVSLHRHDWQASLKPAQRKLLVKIGSNYYNAVSVREKNPMAKSKRKITYARWLVKGLKPLYLYIKVDPDMDMGHAKADAYTAIESEFNVKFPYSPIQLKGDPVIVVKLPDDVWDAKGAKGWAWWSNAPKANPAQSKGKTALKKSGRALKGFAKGALSAGAQILGAGAAALNPARRRKNGLSAAEKLLAINQAYQKHRNVIAKRFDRMTLDQAHAEMKKAGQRSIQDTIHKLAMDAARPEIREIEKANPSRKRNASRTVSTAKTAKRRSITHSKARHKVASPRVRSVAKTRKASASRASGRAVKRRNATHKDSDHPVEVTKHWRAGPPGYLTPWQRAHHAGQKDLFAHGIAPAKKRNAIKRASKRAKRNPSAESIRKTFAGSVSGSRDLYFPKGTPQGLAKLGKLVLIETQQGTIKPVAGTAWLCSDTRGKLHLGSTTDAPLFDGPKRNLGKVMKIEYEDVKRHLGYTKPTVFFHHVGENNGIRPTLHADGKGGLIFKGGDYQITSRGLEN